MKANDWALLKLPALSRYDEAMKFTVTALIESVLLSPPAPLFQVAVTVSPMRYAPPSPLPFTNW